jgi:hypothetical protein
MWYFEEIPDDLKRTWLTDEEIQSLYLLVAYSSHPTHTNIAKKLEPVVRIAKDNIECHSRWKNEGGNAEANNHHE